MTNKSIPDIITSIFQITLLHSKLQSKDNEKISMKKENDQLQKDLKISTANTSCIELRLNRANEECEKVKLALKSAKQEEKVNIFILEIKLISFITSSINT